MSELGARGGRGCGVAAARRGADTAGDQRATGESGGWRAPAMAWRPHLSAAENNGNHIASFSSRANPAPLKASAVTRGFGKFAYPKLARELSEVCDGDEDRLAKRNKALCAALDLLAVPEARVQCIGAGVAEAVAARLSDDEAIGRQRAARCCVYLASDATGCAALLETGALAKLVELLKDKHDDVRDAAYEALLEAAWDAKVRAALASPSSGNIEMLLSQATLEGAERAHKALELLRRTIRGGDDKVRSALGAQSVRRSHGRARARACAPSEPALTHRASERHARPGAALVLMRDHSRPRPLLQSWQPMAWRAAPRYSVNRFPTRREKAPRRSWRWRACPFRPRGLR